MYARIYIYIYIYICFGGVAHATPSARIWKFRGSPRAASYSDGVRFPSAKTEALKLPDPGVLTL